MINYKQKYLKYKSKYLNLKGGGKNDETKKHCSKEEIEFLQSLLKNTYYAIKYTYFKKFISAELMELINNILEYARYQYNICKNVERVEHKVSFEHNFIIYKERLKKSQLELHNFILKYICLIKNKTLLEIEREEQIKELVKIFSEFIDSLPEFKKFLINKKDRDVIKKGEKEADEIYISTAKYLQANPY
jgi:dGTP triphosphohydrolase